MGCAPARCLAEGAQRRIGQLLPGGGVPAAVDPYRRTLSYQVVRPLYNHSPLSRRAPALQGKLPCRGRGPTIYGK
jgi:hypothetical protein